MILAHNRVFRRIRDLKSSRVFSGIPFGPSPRGLPTARGFFLRASIGEGYAMDLNLPCERNAKKPIGEPNQHTHQYEEEC